MLAMILREVTMICPEIEGFIVSTPLKNMSSSDWFIITIGEIKAMFQTTNQVTSYPYSIFPLSSPVIILLLVVSH
jgi:hypothetical protein